MFKNTIFLGFVLLFQVSFSQVTFVVNELPENTPENASIYISGDFEGWTGGHESYKLTKENNTFFITIPEQEHAISFKFTLGSWHMVETEVDNREYVFGNGKEVVKIRIENWSNTAPKKPTAAKNVSILSEEFYMPQLDRKRRVWIYLPPDYDAANKKYPVMYMHDGQSLFDTVASYAGEWEVDETLNKLYQENGFGLIVIGIDNDGEKRMDEYSPWKIGEHGEYGGGEGDAYVNFIIKTLKPYVDKNYRTKPEKENTAIIGSSMGGLISHYAGLKYPDTFGVVGAFSPSFWLSDLYYDFATNHSNNNSIKMYFLAGDSESETMVSNLDKMIELMKANGFNKENIKSKIVIDGQHNDKLWRENFEESIRWLFPEAIKKREFLNAKLTEDGLEVNVSDGKHVIKFYDEKIVETTFFPKGENFRKESHAVIMAAQSKESHYIEENDSILKYFSGLVRVKRTSNIDNALYVSVQKAPFKISYWYNGKEITSERNGYQKNDEFETIQFNLTKDEVLYGGGARALGMNRRGNRLQLYNKAHYGYETESELMNFTLPIVMSSNQYMIHFDNAPIGYLDLDSNHDNTLTYETISGRKTYQVIVGDSWLDIIDNYTNLTGKQPLPPRWALGNFSSRFGYHSQEETIATINKFKDENIPVDAIIIDLYWFGKSIKGTMGNLEFHRDSFPNPKQMITDLRAKNIETILITEPFVLTTSKRWEEVVKKDVLAKDSLGNPFKYDFYFGNTGLIDIYSENGNAWFKTIYKDLIDIGVTGFWGDLGEPEVHPKELLHAIGTADEVHNIYGHDWAKLVKEVNEEVLPNQRPFVLMRAGYSGSQRYGLIPWSGDVNRTWGGLQSQTEIALQMGMQGFGYMHSDLGGFAGANLDDELYERWLQYGVFQPIYRPHAQEEVPSEPVFRSESAKQNAKISIELRYKLLPYNYTLAFENNQKGTPLMRPLFFEESTNKTQQINASTYLWGNDFLVTPIVNSGVKEKEVYFPKENVWFDFYTDEKIAGGQTKTVSVSNENIPTFVRAGAFIPMAKSMQTTKEYTGNDIILHYYYDNSVEESNYELYNDDGLTNNAFEKGGYELLEFEAELKKRCLEIEFEAEIGTHYTSEEKHISLIIHNIQQQPKRIKIDGKKVVVKWNNVNKTVTIPVVWNTQNEAKIKLKLNK